VKNGVHVKYKVQGPSQQGGGETRKWDRKEGRKEGRKSRGGGEGDEQLRLSLYLSV
jgi:hypothetical protein